MIAPRLRCSGAQPCRRRAQRPTRPPRNCESFSSRSRTESRSMASIPKGCLLRLTGGTDADELVEMGGQPVAVLGRQLPLEDFERFELEFNHLAAAAADEV